MMAKMVLSLIKIELSSALNLLPKPLRSLESLKMITLHVIDFSRIILPLVMINLLNLRKGHQLKMNAKLSWGMKICSWGQVDQKDKEIVIPTERIG